MQKTLHLSKIIVTNESDPIFNGGLVIENNLIKQVGKKEDFGDLKNTNCEAIDHGNSLICPGFINLHTHLAYSKIDKLDGTNGLFPWLKKLVNQTHLWTESDYKNSILYGIEQSLSTGTTFIVENTPSILSAQELLKSPLKGLVGLEVFGSDEEKSDEIFQQLLEIEAIAGQDKSCPYIELTFSPHAPYDVSKPLWKKIIAWDEKNNRPILTHLEESPSEKSWWQNKTGDALNFWKHINKLEPKLKYWKKYNSGIDFLNKNNLITKNLLATHLCQADKKDLETLKKHNVKLVHCPRSNYYLNNGTANLKLWDELGLLWGIGTDSLAGNDSLDLLEELRFTLSQQKITYNHIIPVKKAFETITLNGGRILSKNIGCLKQGFEADFLIYDIKTKEEKLCQDPYNLIIVNVENKKDLKEVWINGQKAWQRKKILHTIETC